MGLLDKLKGLFGSGTDQGQGDDAASEPTPAIDAPFGDHERPEVPPMSEADTAGAGFPPEIR